jgi:large subunit ribosomal protein L25
MSELALEAQLRNKKSGLLEGQLPAVVYGRGMDSRSIAINSIEFKKLFDEAGESTIFNLSIDGLDHDVLIHDYQRHPVSYEVSHVDFYAVQKGQKITVSVPLEFIGEAPVKDNPDVQLVYVLHELEVECQPKDLPSEIQVDVSAVAELGDVIHVSELSLPNGVEPSLAPEEVVVSTSAVKEVEEEEEDQTEEFDPSMVEVEGQTETDTVEESDEE